jgi:CelD/BcsL family acetyltransferase involved in cellulose biosynthesis
MIIVNSSPSDSLPDQTARSVSSQLGPPRADAQVAILDPLECSGWDGLLAGRSDSTIFHGTAWARVLQETYGHIPFYFCRIAEGQLQQVLPTMEVNSRWTGRRGIALPFTDLCPLLSEEGRGAGDLYSKAMAYGKQRGWRYLECRGDNRDWPGSAPSLEFYGHVLDLCGDSERMFKRLDGAVRRGIRKAEQSGLQIDFSCDPEAMWVFYALHCETRRRHGVPPQPKAFFENIARYLLGANSGFIATACQGETPLAAAVFFHFGRHAVYKFGASNYAFQHLRPNNLMMWEAIKRLGQRDIAYLHLGRTSLTNNGLRRFKLGFGAREERIAYSRYDYTKQSFVQDIDRADCWVNRLFRLMPPPLFRLAGRLIYSHLS